MRFFDFFKIVYDEVFAVQLLSVSFSIVWIFYPWEKNKKSILIGIANILGVFAGGTVLNRLSFALSSAWRAIAGVHFQLAWLLTIFIYLGIMRRTYFTSRLVMGATLYITVTTTADLGREIMFGLQQIYPCVYFEFTCFIADLMIIAFSLAISRFSLKNYSDIPTVSVIIILVNTFSCAGLIFGKTLMKMANPFQADIFYCFVLAGIYIVSVTGYMMIYFHQP